MFRSPLSAQADVLKHNPEIAGQVDRAMSHRIAADRRIIGVAASVESVKRVPVVSIQRQSEPDALWQVGIRDEMASEGHQIGITLSNASLGSVRFKSARRNNRSRENLSQSRRGDVPLALGDQDVTLNARLNDVQVSESKAV
jgi:hypothetical protein